MVEARLDAVKGRDMSWLYDADLSPPDGGQEVVGPQQGDAVKEFTNYDPACCHKTRLLGAPCPVGRECPYDKHIGSSFDDFLREEGILEEVNAAAQARLAEGSKSAHLPIRTLPDPTPDHALADWIYEAF